MPTKHSTPKSRDAATPAADPSAPPKSKPKGQLSPQPPRAAGKPPDEVLPAPLSKQELRPMINKARRHGRALKRNGQLLAIELRRLQDAGAHQTYGRASFGAWAATEFADLDLSAENAKKLSQAGRALLVLEQHGKIDLDDARTFPGPTGARALSSVLSSHGEQAMLQVHQACPPDHIIGETVAAASRSVLPPAPSAAAPQAALDVEDEDEEPEDEPPEEVHRLQTSIERIRDLLDELYLADDIDPVAVQRAYQHLLEDTEALGSMLSAVAVLPGEDDKDPAEDSR